MVGDRLVYPNGGICRVKGFQEMVVAGRPWTMLVLEREEDGARVSVPQEKLATIGLRKLAGNLKSLSERGEKAVMEVEGLASDLREGKGILGSEVLSTVKQVRDSSQTVQNGFDAMKHLPFVGKHVDPHTKALSSCGA